MNVHLDLMKYYSLNYEIIFVTGRLDVDKKHKKDLIKLARFLQFDSLAEVLANGK